MTGNPKDYEDGHDYGYTPVPGFPILSITKTDPNFYVKNGMTPNEISDFFNDKKNYPLIDKEFSDVHITYGSLTANYDPDDDYDSRIQPDVWCVYKKDSKGNVDYKQVVGDDEKLVEGNGYEIGIFSVFFQGISGENTLRDTEGRVLGSTNSPLANNYICGY